MRRPIVIVLAFVLLLAGCGSSPKDVSKAQYERQLQRLGTALVDAGSQLGQHLDTAAFNQDVENFQDELRSAAKELKGVKPPVDAQGPNERLAEAFHDLADDLDAVKDARRKSLPEAGRAFAAARNGPAARQGRAAVRQLNRRGYAVGQMASL